MTMMAIMLTNILLFMLNNLKKNNEDKMESSSNFEWGFQSQTEKNTKMSSQFFMIAILFLIFDVEIAFIIPIPLTENMMNLTNWNIMIILTILLLGTKMEWKTGLIEWTK
uniref:NADH dehydrogenase subunit 3 n=1 Tax=Lebertia trifurcilla TaxID=450597 RepID=UPI002113CFF8|nr:NADH dehydrogenase subunit 3 [Lebertia trifurcilla]UTE89513.1 NADH dehydrogenase subunit 3 [Lebertia trifurcilla]